MKKILYTFFLLGGLMLFASASFAQSGTYTLAASDSFGDGWQGGSIEVTTITNGTVLILGPATTGPDLFTFDLVDGESVMLCEITPDGFPGEISYTVTDPTGVIAVDVMLGQYTGTSCFALMGGVAGPVVCDEETQCQLDVVLTMQLVGTDFGDGWEGSTLDVTVNGQTNAINTIFGGETTVQAFDAVCLDFGASIPVDVNFVDNSGFDDDEIGWSIAFNGTNFDVDDLMDLQVNPGGGGTNQGDISNSGTITVTCPIPTPTPAPTVSCGIYEIGKTEFLQAPAAIAECTNGFNCEISTGASDENGFFEAAAINTGTALGLTAPTNVDPNSVITIEICGIGDIDGVGGNLEQYSVTFANGTTVLLGGTGNFADQCSAMGDCETVTLPGTAAVNGAISFTATRTGTVSTVLCATNGLQFNPTFILGEEPGPSTDAFACITWYANETAFTPLFVGQELPISVIQAQILSGALPANLLCHEQIATLFVTTACGPTESDRIPVNIYVFEPCTDGCAQYVEMTDGGADGWEGASLTVSENEGPAQELKLTASEGACSVTQFCVADGGSLDLQYWEGADNDEHGYNVINSNGVALAEGPGPSTNVNTVKADCNIASCDTELDLTVRVTYGTNSEFLSWEIYDGFDNVNCQGPQVYGNLGTAGLPPGFQLVETVTVDACNEYTAVLFDGGNNTGSGATFELITSDIDYGTEIVNPMDAFFGQSQLLIITGADFGPTVGEARVSFTVPCKPACEDASDIAVLGDCFAATTVLPVGVAEICPECNHGLGCAITVRHTILTDGNAGTIAFQGAFMSVDGLTEVDYTALNGFQMSAGCHSYVTEYQYCDGLIVKCTANYTVYVDQTTNFACNDNVTIPLGVPDGNPLNGGFAQAQNDDLGECVIRVTADLLIEGGVPSTLACEFFNINDFYEVIILDENDQPLVTFSDRGLPLDSNGAEIAPGSNVQPANNFVSYNEIKETLKYVVTHKITGTTCWGELTVEDKNAPIISTTSYDVNCNDPNAMDEFYSETLTVGSSAATEFPANIQGGDGGNPGRSNTYIPFTVDCGRLGTAITNINLVVDITHTDPASDLGIDFHIPTVLNNSLAMPFPNATIAIRTPGGVSAGTTTFTPAPNDTPALAALLGADAKLIQSEKNVDFISNSSGVGAGAEPQGFGKTYYINVYDDEDAAAADPFGDGTVNSASIILTVGYPFPYAAFDCALDNVELVSEIVEDGCDLLADWNGARIVRVFRATDACGNAANATQIVNLKAPRIADLTLPTEDVTIECGTETFDANGAIDPAQSGSPVFCCDEVTDEDFCKLSISFEDNVLESCGNSLKIFRTWSIFNWCNPTAPTQLQQIIVVGDTTAPMVNGGTTITVDANANCEGDLALDNLDITDGCSAVTAVRFVYQTGSVYLGTGAEQIIDLLAGEMVEGLPIGSTTGVIIATDECGNTSETDATINVVDNSNPTAICDDGLIISLNGNGEARVFATDLDEGSNDNCSDVTVEIRSLGALGAGFGEFADFDCSDLGTVRVELLVTDAAGNTNLCWSDLLVEDPIGPAIVCKDDVTLTCDEALHADDVFSAPDATDNCGFSIEAGDIITQELPNCGQILRQSWTVTDGSDKTNDASCTQTVTLVHVSDFIVQFPADQEFDNCELGNIAGPIVTEDDCENIGISVEDRVFVQVDDACYKIERTYTIINHCIVENPSNGVFTDLGTPLPIPRTFRDDDGFFQYTQIIKVQDNVAPTVNFTAPDPCDFTAGCEGELILTATGEDDCADLADLSFSYKIDAFSDGSIDIEGEGDDASGIYPYGDHIIKWIVTDGCGNVTAEEFPFSIRDCKNPTPIADGLNTVVMNDGGCVNISAAHLLKKAEDNCTERTDEEWLANARIRIEGSGAALATSIDVCCGDVVNGGVNVEVWVEDEAGNADFVLVFVEVQDNLGSCPDNGQGSSLVQGTTATEFGNVVDEVVVNVDGAIVMTDASGVYSTNVPVDQMNNITPEKLDEVTEGISTFDLVLMANHVLQINSLTTPYQHIAADVNADGSIDIFDMVELRELILFSITEFPSNTSWRFVDADYTFLNPTTPWNEAYPQYLDVMSDVNRENEDFVAVKIGDLDGDAKDALTTLTERSFPTTLAMNIDDVELTAGNTYKVDFRASDFNEITGYQFTMNFDQNAADFISVEAGALNVDESNFGFAMLDEGFITTSFTEMGRSISVNDDEVLFSINIAANANATLHNVLSLTNQYTLAEAYNAESEVSDVNLVFNNAGLITTTGGDFELFQNKPNPFNETSLIGFNLPEATTATLRIYDVSGKNLKVITMDAARGYNQVNINRNELGAAGVLYYQLDTDTDSAVKKMIILE